MADIIGLDVPADVALLKIPSDPDLVVLPLATRISEGEDVLALGYPLDYQDSVTITKGIVSALRTIDGIDYVQTDAAINPGNSGGPLLNTIGEVLGMNSLVHRDIVGEEYSAQGIGFAVGAGVLSNQLKTLKIRLTPIPPLLPPIPTLVPLIPTLVPPPPTPFTIPTATLATPQPPGVIVKPVPTVPPNLVSKIMFGPATDVIWHEGDGNIDEHGAGVYMKDVVVEAHFTNPYPDSGSTWSYGFIVRANLAGGFHAFVINSDGNWQHFFRLRQSDRNPVARVGSNIAIDTTKTGSNHVRVIARGTRGEVWINGIYVSRLDLSDLELFGDVSIFANYHTDDGLEGYGTYYENFTVWTPSSG